MLKIFFSVLSVPPYRYFFGYLSKKFTADGLRQSDLDPCLSYGNDLFVIVHVDDMFIYAKHQKDIDSLIDRLKKDKVNMRQEGTVEGYLGLRVK